MNGGDEKKPEQTTGLEARVKTLEAQLALLHNQQQAFAFGISHDLRAPLRAIDGFALQLQRSLEAQGLPPDNPQIEKIRAAVAKSGRLIDALLEYSRVARAQMNYQQVELGFLADWAMMELSAAWPKLPVQMDVQPDVQLWGDERLLQTLLSKILENSWKFSAEHGQVQLSIRAEHTDEGLHLEVRDQGVGMDLRNPGQPFEPFQRLHGASQGAGDGLGLAIAQTIVNRHGGRIWAESSPGTGCSIHLVLPEKAPAPATDLQSN